MASRHGLQIRTATPADAAGIAELMDEIGCSADASAWAARLEALGHGDGIVLLALEWGPPSGLVVLNWYRTLLADYPVAQISTILVGPAQRRRGLGRLLLKAGARAARSAGCGRLQLLTTEGDPSLAAFGDASGFDRGGIALTRPLRKTTR